MSFLNPWMFLAALTVGVPVWLHLRKRTRSDTVRFSAMRFLDDQPSLKARPFRVENWPLLLLRVLTVLLLVAAFAWPYSEDIEREEVVRESRVYVLDNTLSMQADTHLASALEQLLRAVESASPETQIAVVELTDQPRTVVAFGDTRAEAVQKLDKLVPSHRRGSYLAAFQAANDLLARSLGDTRKIIFIGDSQANQWEDGKQVAPFLDGVTVELPEITTTQLPNVAVHDPQVRRVLANDVAIAECSAVLFHQGNITDATLVLTVNGVEKLRRQVRLDNQPERFTVLAEVPHDPGEWLRGKFRVEADPLALAADDQAVFSLPPLRAGRVDVLSDSPFLETALSPDVMDGRWEARFLTIENLDAAEVEPPADVLLVESRFLHSGAVRDRVLDFVNSRRGVVLSVDQVTPVTVAFLKQLGVETSGEVESPADQTSFRYVFSEHPLFQPFRTADFGDLLATNVVRYRRLSVEEGLPLIFSQAGDPLLVQSRKTVGQLFVTAFGFDRRDTDWPVQPTFIPFLDRLLRQARGEKTLVRDYQPGEVCLWEPPSRQQATAVVVRRNGTEVTRAAVEDGRARFFVPDEPGHYDVLPITPDGPDADETTVLNVNPPVDESELTYDPEPQALRIWTLDNVDDSLRESKSSARGASSPQPQPIELTTEEILAQRLWWWLVLGGLVAMILETGWLTFRKA